MKDMQMNRITPVEPLTSSGNLANTLLAEVPVRIQRSRQQKQVSPNGLHIVYVGRPGPWGNPLKLVGDMIYIDASYRRKILDRWVHYSFGDIDDVLHLYSMFFIKDRKFENVDLQFWYEHFQKLDTSILKGKNLSCWCSLKNRCHADVLLQIINE